MSKKIVNEWIVGIIGETRKIKDNEPSTVLLFTAGACLITKRDAKGIKDIDISCFDIPTGACVDDSYKECKKLLSNMSFHPTNERNTQNLMRKFDDGSTKCVSTITVQYYDADDPENSSKIFDEKGNILYRDNYKPFEN